jgi:putative nucleotidyltransferase with HDIG domain
MGTAMRTTTTAPAAGAAPARLQALLNDVQRVRPLPTSVTRVIQALEDPDVSAAYIAHLISLDQALAADVLRLSNAAALASVAATSSVQEAVVRLGFVRVKSLVLGAATASLLTRRLSGYGLTGEELWNHSVATASLARYIADAVGYRDLEEAYVAGLLHDIGKLVLDQYVRVDSNLLVDLMQRRELQLWQAEEQVFGMDHGAVGGLMSEKWQFPVGLTDAIRCHHWPSLARTRAELAAIVNVADALPGRGRARLAVLGTPRVHPEALRLLRLDEAGLERLRADMPWQPGV